jgi:hypothetical protein
VLLAALASAQPLGCTEHGKQSAAIGADSAAVTPASSPPTASESNAPPPGAAVPARPRGPFARACEGQLVDLSWALQAPECRAPAGNRRAADGGVAARAPWPAELRIEIAVPPQGVKTGETAAVEVFFTNTGPAPLRLVFNIPRRTKGGGSKEKDTGGERFQVYPLSPSGRRLDFPSYMLGFLSGGSDEVAVVTLATAGWARALGELRAEGYAPNPKAKLEEALAPLPPGRYRLGVTTNLPFAPPPPLDAFLDVL